MPSDNEASTPVRHHDEPQEQPAPPSPTDSRSEEGEARSDDDDDDDAPPLPHEPLPGAAPPLPAEAPPDRAAPAAAAAADDDDGWSAEWDAANQTWYFYNRFTGVSQWDNPRVPTTTTAHQADASASAAAAAPPAQTISQPGSVAGGYNPAIHGSWDPNAPYAQVYKDDDVGEDEHRQQALSSSELLLSDSTAASGGEASLSYARQAAFNARTGKFQTEDQNPERHSDAAKSARQMNAFFDVDRAANSHDGRSLKAERRGKQPTKKELAAWKEKRKARKEEKRRAWLRD